MTKARSALDGALSIVPARGETIALALVLHGGRARGTEPARERQLAVVRMRPFATALARAAGSDGLTVARLRNDVRGWNGSQRSPVAHTEQALDELTQRYPDVPIALVGHSMGGRTAVYVAGHQGVRAVVGLAPWLERGDPVEPLTGRRVLFAHGTRDRMTSAAGTQDFAERARGYAQSVGFVSVHDGRHAMLARADVWTGLVTGFVVGVLLHRPPRADGTELADVLEQVLAGKQRLSI